MTGGSSGAAVLTAMLCACAGTPVPPPPPTPELELDLHPTELPAYERMLEGFDPVVTARDWRRGDRALLGLELRDGEETRRWLVLVTVEDVALSRVGQRGEVVSERMTWQVPIRDRGNLEFTSEMMALRVLVADEDGRPLGESMVKVPRQLLEKGFARACAANEHGPPILAFDPDSPHPPDEGPPEDKRPHAEAVLSLVALLGIVKEDPILSSLMWEVVEPPSLLSVIWNLGVTVTLRAHFTQAVRARSPPPHLPDTGAVWWVPFTLLVNDSPALFCELLVTSPWAPITLSGGIVGIHARHPSRPDLQFTMALLAARRGEPSAASTGTCPAFEEPAAEEGRDSRIP